ncbi:DUF1403 family protein [Roseobacter sp.]|uniref:DUF1403 family protein n=1 Tax=Roseobacter sp. TaxID=1907202 RepID=UPI002966E77F|nr:DUF1403 family protein [Roseobacter sp.]MDW3183318.1 DUF1403 family protein [Roseobacter sp.]
MTFAQNDADAAQIKLPQMPGWVIPARAELPEDVAFLSGAALATLHVVLGHEAVPQPLLRERLALRAAEACVALSGRPERADALRDEVHLLRPGDQPGPAGAVYQQWRRAVSRPISAQALHRATPGVTPENLSGWMRGRATGPVGGVAAVLEAVLNERPGEEQTALILADAVLARSLGWKFVLPLMALGLKSRDLRKHGADLQMACHRAVVAATRETLPMAADLTRKVDRLIAVAPKLRTKRAGDAVVLFQCRDAIAPAISLAPLMSGRAARRLCDRLVHLGVVRELTGRDTFRLYGV